MLSDKELETLMTNLESYRVERKASVVDKDKIRQAICAFANDISNSKLPGIVFIGVNDDGTCANLNITDALLLNLSDIRDDGNILPFPSMIVQKRVLNGCNVVVIEVQPSYDPPVRCNGRTWIRTGPRRATATAEDERRLTEKRRSGDLTFDRKPVNGATLNDLNLKLFQEEYLPGAVSPETLAENHRSIDQELASLHLLTNGIPNYGAILAIGRNPRMFVPGAYIQFIRFDGVKVTDPIRSEKEIYGPLADMLNQLNEILDANISVAVDITSGPRETRQPNYPIVALQQLAYNAVLHRTYEGSNAPIRMYWYDDRIEILSPGGPYGMVNENNFGEQGVTDYRNPLLAEAMRALRYAQRFGIGIPLAREALSRNGNPPPEFSVESSSILVTVKGVL